MKLRDVISSYEGNDEAMALEVVATPFLIHPSTLVTQIEVTDDPLAVWTTIHSSKCPSDDPETPPYCLPFFRSCDSLFAS
jgi:hypothetical protein